MQTADAYGHENWTTEKEAHAHNSRLAKKRVQWLFGHSTSYQILRYIDGFVLRNPPPSASCKYVMGKSKNYLTTTKKLKNKVPRTLLKLD